MPRKKRYILICTDYVTKWVESKYLYQANEQYVVDFLFEEIFTCFGVPKEIVINQGTQSMSKLVISTTQHYKIRHRTSSPYHPQENGQVKSTNKVLEAILKNAIQSNHKD